MCREFKLAQKNTVPCIVQQASMHMHAGIHSATVVEGRCSARREVCAAQFAGKSLQGPARTAHVSLGFHG
jgi:hypothetical protein